MKNKAGMERILTAKINYLAKHTDHHLFLLTYEQGGCPLPFNLDKSVQQIHIDNVIPQRKDYTLWGWFMHYLSARKRFCRCFKQTIEHIKPDVIICNVYSFSIIDLIIRISTSAGIKTIIESHTKLSSTFISHKFRYNKLLLFLIKQWDLFILNRLKSTSYVVALTEQDAEDWKKYVKKVVIIPNFITIEPKPVKDYAVKRVISAGRYSYEKGYDMLLKTWAMVIKDYPDWELHIFGDGDRTPYIQLSEQLGITNTVYLHPSTSDIVEEFSKSSIYIMASRYEGFGLVLVEAMSCGLPCIAFDCPYGPRNIISNDEDGFLVTNGDIQALFLTITRVINNVDLRHNIGKKAVKTIRHYNSHTIMKRWGVILNNLTTNEKRI